MLDFARWATAIALGLVLSMAYDMGVRTGEEGRSDQLAALENQIEELERKARVGVPGGFNLPL